MRDGHTSKDKELPPSIIIYTLNSFYLTGLGATTFTQINKEKTTLIDKGVRLDPWVFISWSLVDRKSSHETVQVTCTLEMPRWGDPRRPVPTAASVAAVEPRPCQGEVIRAPAGNALRGTNGSFMLS